MALTLVSIRNALLLPPKAYRAGVYILARSSGVRMHVRIWETILLVTSMIKNSVHGRNNVDMAFRFRYIRFNDSVPGNMCNKS